MTGPPGPARDYPPGGDQPPRPAAPLWYQRPDRPDLYVSSSQWHGPATQPAPAATPGPAPRKKLVPGLLIGAGILVVLIGAAVLLSVVSRLGLLGDKVLDVSKVQAGVLQVLSDPASGYGANVVTEVSCNNGRNPPAAKGNSFTCDVTVNGAKRRVTVLVSDDHGTYEVDRPR